MWLVKEPGDEETVWLSDLTFSSSVLLSSLELSNTKVYKPQIRALLGTDKHFCEVVRTPPQPSERGTDKTVTARFWPWLAGKSPQNLSRCSLFARKRSMSFLPTKITTQMLSYYSVCERNPS